MGKRPNTTYFLAEKIDPHKLRAREMLAQHPDLRALMGNAPSTAGWVAVLSVSQTFIAYAVSQFGGWTIALAATGGAFISLGLWVLIHECAHNLVFKSRPANMWLATFASLPLLFPAAAAFRSYHLCHHRHFGHLVLDPDVPSIRELRLVGRSPWRKILWLALFPIVLSVRSSRIRHVKILDRWFAANLGLQVAYALMLWWAAGVEALVYLAIAHMLAMGLHPLGARSIQEHFSPSGVQETTSYYGPLNRMVFNAGYHVEHHDLMQIPWRNLPKIRTIAPEFYNDLTAHRSWLLLLVRFVSDRRLSLADRKVRPDMGANPTGDWS